MKQLIIKTMLIGSLISIATLSLKAQDDSLKTKKKIDIDYGVSIKIKTEKDTLKKKSSPAFLYLTFTRFDLGLTRLNDNGSLTLSPTNDFLDYRPWKTSHVSFDILQAGYRFSDHFRIYLGGGFDWTLIRLDKDITIQKNQPLVNYVADTIQFSKNRFSASYVHFPLNFEFRSSKSSSGRRFRFAFGPEIAFLMDGKVKQVSAERGKTKVSDNYHFTPFRYGVNARMGYGGLGLFFKYYANDMFDTAPQKGLKNIAFGLTFGLN